MIEYNKIMKLKDICSDFGFEYNESHSSRSLRDLRYEYEIEQISKQKFKVIRKLDKTDKQKHEEKFHSNYSQFLIDWELRECGGIYIIQKDNDVYIGQTNNFLRRFRMHKNKANKYRTRDMIRNGATMKLLELEDDLSERLRKETSYVEQYKSKGYNMINNESVLYTERLKIRNGYRSILIEKDRVYEVKKILDEIGIKYRKRGE